MFLETVSHIFFLKRLKMSIVVNKHYMSWYQHLDLVPYRQGILKMVLFHKEIKVWTTLKSSSFNIYFKTVNKLHSYWIKQVSLYLFEDVLFLQHLLCGPRVSCSRLWRRSDDRCLVVNLTWQWWPTVCVSLGRAVKRYI